MPSPEILACTTDKMNDYYAVVMGVWSPFRPLPNVRFGSLADITARLRYVRFTPQQQTLVSGLSMSALCH